MSKNVRMLKGLKSLVQDAVEHGSRAVEKIQLETARRPFVILEHIPAIAAPAKVVHVIHDASVGVTHAMIRGINAVVGKTLDAVLDVAAATDADAADPDGSARTSVATAGSDERRERQDPPR